MRVVKTGFPARLRNAASGRGQAGLTLLEVALSLTILCVLAIALAPMLLNAREQARQATCISNLGQIGAAFMEYAQDNDGTFFNPYYFEYYKGDRDCGYTSASTLEPYVKNHAAHDVNCVWVCPDVTKFGMPRTTSKIGFGAFYCTYTMNVFLIPPQPKAADGAGRAIPAPDACYADPVEQFEHRLTWRGQSLREERMVFSEPQYVVAHRKLLMPDGRTLVFPVLHPTRLGIRLSQIASPLNTDLLFEGVVEDYGREGIDTGYVGRAPRQGDYTLDQGFWPDDTMASSKWGYPLQSATPARHIRLNNYLFCDGHVKALAPRRYPYDIQHDPDNIWFTQLGRNGSPIPPPGGPGC